MKKDIRVSIAAGGALLFLDEYFGTVSFERFEQYLKSQRMDPSLVLGFLLSEKLITIIKNEERIYVLALTEMCLEQERDLQTI